MKKQNLIQAIAVFVVIAAAVFVAMNQTLPPDALPASALATEFSAERAIAHLKAIAQEIRLPGTPAHEEARDYVIGELVEMGLSPEIQKTTSNGPDYGYTNFSSVENVVARIEGSEFQEAILLVAHLDSTPFSPGATDDGSGVAIMLETARALQADPPLRNTVILLFTDSEEPGLQGAAAFATQHRWAENVKLVVNIDAGGVSGPSILTATSPDNGWLIREYARADPYAAGNSTITTLAKPSSDFKVFKAAGLSGYNIDFSWDRLIHTRLDSMENVNPPSIQHQGYHFLALASHFGDLALEDPRDPNPIYFNLIPNRWMVHYPTAWAIPIMLVVALVFAGVVVLGFRRQILNATGMGFGALVIVVALITAPLLVRALWALISSAVPLYQFPLNEHAYNAQLLGTAFTSTTLALTATWYVLIQKVRKVSTHDLTMGALAVGFLAMVGMTIASPETSYALTWPLLFNTLAAGYWFYSMNDDTESFSAAQIAGLLVASVVAIMLIVPSLMIAFKSNPTDEVILFVALLMALLAFLVPLLHIITRPHKWWLPIAAGLLALGTLGAAILDDFDASKPQQSTAFYVLDADAGQAFWAGGAPDSDHLDEWTAQFFPAEMEKQPIPGFPVDYPFFVTAAPAASLAAPQVELVNESTSGGVRTLHLHFSSPRNAHEMVVLVSEGMEVISVEVFGVSSAPLFGTEVTPDPGVLFFYNNVPSEGIDAVVQVGTGGPVALTLVDISYGLPKVPGMSIDEPMPDHVIPSPYGFVHRTHVIKSFTFDGGGE